MQSLPDGRRALDRFVDAPPALARRLSHIGIVSRALGQALQSELKPGQLLVSREGDVWRWDGFTAAADAPSAAAKRLAERNRLVVLEAETARSSKPPWKRQDALRKCAQRCRERPARRA